MTDNLTTTAERTETMTDTLLIERERTATMTNIREAVAERVMTMAGASKTIAERATTMTDTSKPVAERATTMADTLMTASEKVMTMADISQVQEERLGTKANNAKAAAKGAATTADEAARAERRAVKRAVTTADGVTRAEKRAATMTCKEATGGKTAMTKTEKVTEMVKRAATMANNATETAKQAATMAFNSMAAAARVATTTSKTTAGKQAISNPTTTFNLPTAASFKHLDPGKTRSMTAASARDVESGVHDSLLPSNPYQDVITTLPTKYIPYSTGADPSGMAVPTWAESTLGGGVAEGAKHHQATCKTASSATYDHPATLTTTIPSTTTPITLNTTSRVSEYATMNSVSEQPQQIRSVSLDGNPEAQPPEDRSREELQRQRPDAIFIDWVKRRFVILEFTRPYDNTKQALLDTDRRKREKYEQLLRKMKELLPGWDGSIATFSLGVKGTVLEPQWKKALRSLNIPDPHHPRIILSAVKEAMKGLDTMLLARSAQLQLGQGAANVPRQPLFPNPQSRQPSLG